MTADLYDDDPASAAARRWVEYYVGSHRAPDEDVDGEVMTNLVSAALAARLGQSADCLMATDRAYARLFALGYQIYDAVLAVNQGRAAAKAEADEILADMGVCLDPAGHDVLEASAAQELRLPSPAPAGCCPWCGGVR